MSKWTRAGCFVGTLTLASVLLVAIGPSSSSLTGLHKIQHVIVVMQENRSFDQYFGTYPGAAGIPMSAGVPTVCVPDPATGHCQRPYVNHADDQGGGPHDARAATADIDGGKMDGFVAEGEAGLKYCEDPDNEVCSPGPNDVMGYHTQSDIPNYWSYAKNYVLQDHMFEPDASWSLPAHLFAVSEWSANCATHNAPSSCTNALMPSPFPKNDATKYPAGTQGTPIYAWTDLTYLLHKSQVPWKYYVARGTEPDCQNPQTLSCTPVPQQPNTPGIWNPLPYFDTVVNDQQVGNIQSLSNFYSDAKNGSLPAVSWITPSGDMSEHPPSSVSAGQSFVTSLVNAVMASPQWSSTAIFVTWDDWGGFYDHVVPPNIDQNGYGLRVPGLLISPYARKGYIDHQQLSFDAYAKFIEDDFLGGRRLDPATDGRPDPRPSVRETASGLGDLAAEFDFSQVPRAPLPLPVHPSTTLTASAPFGPRSVSAAPGNASATVHWAQPLSDGGSAITGYRIVPYVGSTAQTPRAASSTATSLTVGSLTNGVTYSFTIAAVNALGVGAPSAHTAPITVGAPTAPTISSVGPGNTTASVSWTSSGTNGAAIEAYDVTAQDSAGNLRQASFDASSTTRVFSGLTNGTSYTFTVAAVNANGTGPASLPSTPISVGSPTSPRSPSATAKTASALVRWSPPLTSNGNSIVGYVVTPYLGGVAAQTPTGFSASATSGTVPNLTSGKSYTFTVTARNGWGLGTSSIQTTAVKPT